MKVTLEANPEPIVCKQLWTIAFNRKMPVVPADHNGDGRDEGMLVYKSRAQAQRAADYQNAHWDLGCVPCRLLLEHTDAT